MFGLSDSEFLFLNENLVKPLKDLGCTVYIFGSRATGQFQKFSDIDLIYNSKNKIEKHILFQLLQKMEDSNFSYKIALVDENVIAASFKDKINREKIEL